MDAGQRRDTLLEEKPSVTIAIFSKERYLGTYTSDLLSDESSTFFDGVGEFMRLQEEAMEQKALGYRKNYDLWISYMPT